MNSAFAVAFDSPSAHLKTTHDRPAVHAVAVQNNKRGSAQGIASVNVAQNPRH